MTHFFFNEIDKESVVNIITAIDSDEADSIDLYFSSVGGELPLAEILIDYISNSIKDITLIGTWEIGSAALEVYLRSVCHKRLLNDAYGVVHIADRKVSARRLTKEDVEECFLIKDMNDYNEKWLSERKQFFTNSEYKRLINGNEVYLDRQRLEQYFNSFGYVLEEEAKE